MSKPGALTFAIVILAALCVIDLFARFKRLEKAKLIGLGRVIIEIVILAILYIITIKNINNTNTSITDADKLRCGTGYDTYMASFSSYYNGAHDQNKTFAGLFTSFLVIDLIMIAIGFLKKCKGG